jgi:hypothetical protein
MLKIKDLKKGEIYYGSWENGDKRCIFKQGVAAINSLDQFDNYSKEWCTSSIVTLRESTLGEKHWLNECIKANKFISYEEAMKTFTQKFETGKWYKLGEWISKFSHLKNNEFWGENICIKDNYRDPLGWLDLDAYTPKLITNLEEIQEFLPANHPDKVSNSLIGRYVKCLRDIGNLKENEYDLIRVDDSVFISGKKSGRWKKETRIGTDFELMPVGFCPDEVSNFSTQSFKTGDFVYLEKHFKHNIETEDWSKDLPLNEKLEVISTSTTNKNLWIRFKGYSFEHPACKFKLWEESKQIIKEKPMETNNEFKVGEYVITKGYSTDYDGRVLKITKISNGYYYFEILDNGYYNKNHNFDDSCILRRAKLEEIPTKDLSNEELLSIAKTYYPIGTKFICPSFTKATENNEGNIVTHHAISISYDGNITGSGFYYLRHDNKWAEIISSPNEIKGIKPSDEIEIGDEVEVTQRDYEFGKKGIVQSYHTTNYFDISDLKFPYNKDQLKLIRKANNTTTLIQTKKDDVLSPKVENKVTVQIIERKIKNPILNISVQEENQSIFVPLIQKETKKINNITIKNFSLTI